MTEPAIWHASSWMELMNACAKSQEYLLNQILNLKYSLERGHHHTLIRSISSRLKTQASLSAKLARFDLPDTPASASEHLHDIVGIRIICAYLSDIGEVVDALKTIPKFQILEIKDYITHPKPGGYRSLHVIGLCTAAGHPLQCELQLRTTSMDAWAALEHQMRYKKDLPESRYVNEELKACAKLLYETDERMEKIYRFIRQRDA